MTTTREQILKAVEGKAAERGLESRREGDLIFITYAVPQDAREDNLHKQSIRALVKRIAPDWLIHLDSIGDLAGFTAEVRPKPSTKDTFQGRAPQPSNMDRLERLARDLADELAKLRSG